MTDFNALAARAEAGGDPTLDADVALATGWKKDGDYWWPPEISEKAKRMKKSRWVWYGPEERAPYFSTSIDAQTRWLPGLIISMEMHLYQVRDSTKPISWEACAENGEDDFGDISAVSATAPTESLARLAAILRAMGATGERNE